MVFFSGGSKVGEKEFYEDIRGIREGGGFGSIIGRNSFQRPRQEAVRFLKKVMEIYAGS
jgi:class I fructose-bisphosphate aldolase